MQVVLKYVQSIAIEGLNSGDTIRVEDDMTVDSFMNRLNLEGADIEKVQPVINGSEVDLNAVINNGDELFLDFNG